MQTLVDTDISKSFTGKLVQRHYKRGQPYVQLVFKGARQSQLSLSRNAPMLRSLKVGNTYRVTGPEYIIGDKTFIHEPEVLPAPAALPKKRLAIVSVAAFLLILTGSVLAARHFAADNAVQAESNMPSSQQSDVAGASTITANQATAAPTAVTASTPTPTTTPVVTPKPVVARITPASQTTPVVQQPAAAAQQQMPPVDPPLAQSDPLAQPETPPTDNAPPPVDNPPVTPPVGPVDPNTPTE